MLIAILRKHFHLNNLIFFTVLWTTKKKKKKSKALNIWLEGSLTHTCRGEQQQKSSSHLWMMNTEKVIAIAYKLWAGSSNLTIYCNSATYIQKAIMLQKCLPFLLQQANWLQPIFLPEVSKSTIQLKQKFKINNFSKVK